MTVEEKILKLTRQLYPTGRAFKMPVNSQFEKLHKGLAKSEARAYNDALSILANIIPDNNSFTEEDATAWERRLGMIVNPLVSLGDRKQAILRKMAHPGTIPARSNYRFLEKQLQDAGFDVYVFENIFDDGMGGLETKPPGELTGGVGVIPYQYGDFQYGDFQYGGQYGDVVVNSLDPEQDLSFNIGSNLRSTFFIGGSPTGTFADVDSDRRTEFRQLILRTKPVQTVAFLFINYI